MTTPRYKTGQRWKFATDVAEFEDSLVIGRKSGRSYDVYVRYVPSKSVPRKKDGEVLQLTEAGLKRNVTELVERGVKLPWWWVVGVRCDSKDKAPDTMHVALCTGLIRTCLRDLYLALQQEREFNRQRAAVRKAAKREIEKRGPVQPSRSISESWDRLRAIFPNQTLNPGATAATIASFEKTTGLALPDDFKESLRRHDGGDFWFTPTSGEFLSLDGMLKQWKMFRQLQRKGEYATEDWEARAIKGPIKPVFWSTKRLFVTDNSGDHWTLDLDPPVRGTYGQIVDHCHEVGPTHVLARSWAELLSQLVVDLESGKYL